jgi:ATP-dependent Lhr-like helicase
MYEDDRMRSGKTSRLRHDLIRDVVFAPEIRPAVTLELVRAFEEKRKRIAHGYAPDSPQDLLDWVKERVLIPFSEWESLLAGIRRDLHMDPDTILSPIARKLVRILPPRAGGALIASLENLPDILHAFYHGEEVSLEAMADSSRDLLQRSHTSSKMNQDELFTSLLAEWIAFLGPTTPSFVRTTLGLEGKRLDAALEDLADSERLIAGTLIKESPEQYLCDADNFEFLLRMARAEARPSFEPLQIERLQPFLAAHQGIIRKQTGMDVLFRRVEQLACYYAPAGAWESELLLARLRAYDPSWLDAILQTSEIAWRGRETRRICFVFKNDLDLIEQGTGDRSSDESGPEGLFPDPRAKYDFSTLLRMSGSRPLALSEKLWGEVWKGRVTNDSFAALRRGLETGFKVQDPPLHPGGRSHFSRWRASLPFPGNWYRIIQSPREEGLIEREERNKDRARILLDRYGIVFRELLRNELPAFRWSTVFRALRLMELSGEVLTGYFFHGIPGPQFISHEAFRALQRSLNEDSVFWFAAIDPASLCGVQLESLKGKLPKRIAGTHVVYRGSVVVLVSHQNGKRLSFHIPPDDPDMPACLEFLHILLNRSFQPVRRIVIENINGRPAGVSPYVAVLRALFDLSIDHRKVVLYSRHRS